MLVSIAAVLGIAIAWAVVAAASFAVVYLRRCRDRKASWHWILPILSLIAIASFAATSLGVIAYQPDADSNSGVITGLVASIDFPLYAAAWTAACGAHPILRSRQQPAGAKAVLAVLLTAAATKLAIMTLLASRPYISSAWDENLGIDSLAASQGAFGAAALVAVSTSCIALSAVVALAAAVGWRGYTGHFRVVLCLAFAGTCLVFLAPSLEAAAQAGLGRRCSAADIVATASSGDSSDVSCTVVVLGCTVLLPRLLAATVAAAVVEYQASTALRAQAGLHDTLRLSLPGQQQLSQQLGASADRERGGRRGTWMHQIAPPRSATVSVSNPITELELGPAGGGAGMALALTPTLTTGESQRRAAAEGWGTGDSSRSIESGAGFTAAETGGFAPMLSGGDGIVVEAESAAGSVPVTPVPSMSALAGERSRFDSAGGVFDWGRRRGWSGSWR